MAKRRKPEPPPRIELHIDFDDERVVEAIARLLLDLSEHREQPATGRAQPRVRPPARKATRKRPRR